MVQTRATDGIARHMSAWEDRPFASAHIGQTVEVDPKIAETRLIKMARNATRAFSFILEANPSRRYLLATVLLGIAGHYPSER